MRIAIHQPNFFPWLGYFHKILHCDYFVFLDDVPYGSRSWINRVKILIGGEPRWLTLPVQHQRFGEVAINAVEVNFSPIHRKKMLKTISYNYAKTPFFEDVWELVQKALSQEKKLLADLNLFFINELVARLGISNDKFIRSSSLGINSQGTDRLIQIVKTLSGDSYLCGGGASGYQEDEKFKQHGIDLIYQNFVHPVYPQDKDVFVPGLSILDAVFRIGFSGVKDLLMGSRINKQVT